jgi:hypothetical protein
VLAYGWIVFVLLVTLAPHIGMLLLMSFSKVWSFSVLPDSLHAGPLRHRVQRLQRHDPQHAAVLRLAAGLDVLLGTAIAYLICARSCRRASGWTGPGHDRAGGAGHGAGHRLPAPVQGRERAGHRHLLATPGS